jgi:hypothetical protein
MVAPRSQGSSRLPLGNTLLCPQPEFFTECPSLDSGREAWLAWIRLLALLPSIVGVLREPCALPPCGGDMPGHWASSGPAGSPRHLCRIERHFPACYISSLPSPHHKLGSVGTREEWETKPQ